MQTSTLEHWWPVTHDFGLIRSDVDTIAAVRPEMYRDAGLEVEVTPLQGRPDDCFSRLEPLSPAPTKEMYLATTFGWSAFFQNGCRGSDPFLPMLQLSRALGVTALRACVTPAAARYQAVILEVYDTPDAGGDAHGRRRSIAAANDGGRWVFDQSGTPFPFEDAAAYQANRRRDRFTPAMLRSFLAELGIPDLADETIGPGGQCRGYMIARPPHDHLPRYSLAQAKAL